MSESEKGRRKNCHKPGKLILTFGSVLGKRSRRHVSCLRLEDHRLVDTEQAFLHFILWRGIKNSAAFGLPGLISNAWCTAPRNPRIRLLPPTAQAQNPIAHNCLWLIHKTLHLVLSRLRDLPPVQLSSLTPLLWLVRASGSCFSLNTAKELRPPLTTACPGAIFR